jgi:hypothetical protein
VKEAIKQTIGRAAQCRLLSVASRSRCLRTGARSQNHLRLSAFCLRRYSQLRILHSAFFRSSFCILPKRAMGRLTTRRSRRGAVRWPGAEAPRSLSDARRHAGCITLLPSELVGRGSRRAASASAADGASQLSVGSVSQTDGRSEIAPLPMRDNPHHVRRVYGGDRGSHQGWDRKSLLVPW